jgi:hypothetical protein
METVKIIWDENEVEIPKADLAWFKEQGAELVGESKKTKTEK